MKVESIIDSSQEFVLIIRKAIEIPIAQNESQLVSELISGRNVKNVIVAVGRVLQGTSVSKLVHAVRTRLEETWGEG